MRTRTSSFPPFRGSGPFKPVSRLQQLEQLSTGLRPVTDPVFLLGGKFPHGFSVFREEKQRIVTKAVRSLRFQGNAAMTLPPDPPGLLPGNLQCHHAYKEGFPPLLLHSPEGLEQFFVVCPVV